MGRSWRSSESKPDWRSKDLNELRQADLHSSWVTIMVDPLTEVLRKDLRFSEFLTKVGVPSQDSRKDR